MGGKIFWKALKSATAPAFFSHLINIENGLVEGLVFGNNEDVMFPWDQPKDFRHFQLVNNLLTFFAFVPLVSNLLTYFRVFKLATKLVAFFNVLKFVTSLVTNLANDSLAFFNFFLENLAKNKNIVYFCMVRLSSEGAN